MKVYELINELSKLPAGANVEFATVMTLEEFVQCPIVDSIDGKDAYRIAVDIKEAVCIDDALISLYR
jgi:hypothetical protein